MKTGNNSCHGCWQKDRWARSDVYPETAQYICESCGKGIAEHHKTAMLAQGEWRACAPEQSGRTAGFHLSSLYSPVGWRSWAEIAAAWELAAVSESRSTSAIKTFKNTELGETWVEEGESPDWQHLLERREDYRIGTIPEGGILLTAGADIQKDRIEVSVWAFGRNKASWLVEHRILMGDTARTEVWSELGQLPSERWTHSSGNLIDLKRLAIDTGFATQEAYSFVRKLRNPKVIPIKGVPRGAALIGTPSAVDANQSGKKLRRGVKVFPVAGGIAKLELYNNLRKTPDIDEATGEMTYPDGYVHLPKVDAEYLQQLCAEQLVTKRDRNGFAKREWQKMRERNEALDCYVYARAAATSAGLDRFEERHWTELELQLGIRHKPQEIDLQQIEPVGTSSQSITRTPRMPRKIAHSKWLA